MKLKKIFIYLSNIMDWNLDFFILTFVIQLNQLRYNEIVSLKKKL